MSDISTMKWLLYLYLLLFVGCIIGLFFVPGEFSNLRWGMGFIVYGTGLPLLVATFLTTAQKRGWLK
jgi:hypothetical protein